MQRLEVSGAVRPLQWSLVVKGLMSPAVAALGIMPFGLSCRQRLGCPVLRWSVGSYSSNIYGS